MIEQVATGAISQHALEHEALRARGLGAFTDWNWGVMTPATHKPRGLGQPVTPSLLDVTAGIVPPAIFEAGAMVPIPVFAPGFFEETTPPPFVTARAPAQTSWLDDNQGLILGAAAVLLGLAVMR